MTSPRADTRLLIAIVLALSVCGLDAAKLPELEGARQLYQKTDYSGSLKLLFAAPAKAAAATEAATPARGERAGEVVETITEFPTLNDPRTGGSLMDRTVIICNTSSMPVAAREASIYTGLTIGEYYRQMGLRVLLIADSTSRWAQAMRETSGRLEEIPGEEGFPAYLDSSIKGVYERAGVVRTNDGTVGALTMIGTV